VTLGLVTPDARWAASYVEALREGFRRGTEPLTPRQRIDAIAADFAAFLAELQDQDRVFTTADGAVLRTVPFSIHWLVEGETFIGEVSFRHVLTDRLLQSGGNIGFGIRPSFERRGHAKRMLALALDEARKRGLARVLLTAHEWNIGSRRVIEANGGVLENTVEDINGGGKLRRYWITF